MTTSTLPEWDENRRCRSYSSWTNSISPEREDDFINSSSDDQSKQKHREGSLSSALSDISSSSSCFKPPPPKSEHLTVIVKNKKRRKDKEKRRSRHRSKKDKHKLFDRNPEESTSRTKEIFASGNNILVSVCFDNKDMDEEKKTKKKKKRRKKEKRRHKDRHKRDDVEVEEPKNWKKEPIVEKSRKKTDLKPVAIIDLDRSPKTRDITPKNVIVLSDDDTTGRGRVVKRKPESPVKKFLPLHLDDKHEVSSSIILPQEVDKIGPSTPPTPKSLMDKGAKNESSVNMSSTMSSHNSPVVSIDKFTESYDEDMLDLHATTPLNSPSPVKNAAQKKTYSRSANLSQPSSTSVAPSLPKKPTIHTIVLEDTDEGSISPYSPNSSDYEDLFEPPQSTTSVELTEANLKKVFGNEKDTLYGALRRNYKRAMLDRQRRMCPAPPPQAVTPMDDTFMDDIPNSAVDMQVKDKFVKKMHRQERVVEEVKLFLKPHFNKKTLTKDEYKDILRRAVPKICHSRSGEINPVKIQALCNAYVKKAISKRKVSVKSVTSGNAIVSSTTTSIS